MERDEAFERWWLDTGRHLSEVSHDPELHDVAAAAWAAGARHERDVRDRLYGGMGGAKRNEFF